MTTFVNEVRFFNADMNLEYSVVSGIFSNKEDAKAKATKDLREQQNFWEGSYAKVMHKQEGYVAVRLMSAEGYYKVYTITAMEMK